jgi:glutamyl-Q tRNA(Asp) synthetase
VAQFNRSEFTLAGRGFAALATLHDKNDPRHAAQLHARAGLSFMRAEDSKNAEKEYDAALKLEKDDPEIWMDRATFRASTEHYWDALSDLNQALKITPDMSEALRLRGQVWLKLGNTKNADADFVAAEDIEAAQKEMIVTRFAPSPTGYLHLGHAYSALFTHDVAKREGGKFLLRIEDIDLVRCKSEFTTAIFEDLKWLGLTWEEPVRFQSKHMHQYAAALFKLRDRGILYPCFCTRSEVIAEAAAAGHAPHGPDGPIYAGTCRYLSDKEAADKLAEHKTANWRLNIEKAMALTGALFWHDRAKGKIEAKPQEFGDVVIARKDVPTSYHLSVTVDDHLQGITLVTRGEDLFRSTDIHRLLQALLEYETPDYHHHPLLLDEQGKRFAKRDQSITLRALHESGLSPNDLKKKFSNSVFSATGS